MRQTTWQATSRATSAATAGLVLLLASACTGSGSDSASTSPSAEACFDRGQGFAGEARLYIEHNATDEDTGVHGLVEQEGLSEACITTPDGTRFMVVDPTNEFDALGLNTFFWESREPPNDEYSVADLKADFPEGRYRVSGIDFQGTRRVGTAEFSHDIPAAPEIAAPRLVPEEQAASNRLAPNGLTVRWKPVSRTIDGNPVTITGYEVIVTKVEHNDPHGLSRPVYDVHVPPDTTELAVVDGFLQPSTLYELEVLALERSGNQTITVGFFTTR